MTMWLGLVWVVAGLAIALVGMLAGYGRLPYNTWVGIRLPSSLASPGAWEAGHLAAAPWLSGGGGLVAMTGALLLIGRPDTVTASAISVVMVVFVVVTVVGAAAVGDRAAKKHTATWSSTSPR